MGSYYDIDAILTDAQKVPCTFDLDIPGLGYLDENAGGDVRLPVSKSFPSVLPLPTLHPIPKAQLGSQSNLSLPDQSRHPCLSSPLAQHPARGPTSRSLFSSIVYARFAGFYIAKGIGSVKSWTEDCGSQAVGESLL